MAEEKKNSGDVADPSAPQSQTEGSGDSAPSAERTGLFQLTRARSQGIPAKGRKIFKPKNKGKSPMTAGSSGPAGKSFIHQAAVTNQMIRMFHVSTVVYGHEGCVNTLSFDESGKLLVSGGDDLNIKIWDVEKQMHRQDPVLNKECSFESSWDSGHTSNIFGAQFVPGSQARLIVSCARDGHVRHSTLASDGSVETVRIAQHAQDAHRIAFDPQNNNIVYSAGVEGSVFQIDLREGPNAPKQKFLVGETARVFTAYDHIEGKADYSDAQLKTIWGIHPDEEEDPPFFIPHFQGIFDRVPDGHEYYSVGVNPTDSHQLLVGTNRAVMLYDLRLGADERQSRFTWDQAHFKSRLTDACWTADGKILATACRKRKTAAQHFMGSDDEPEGPEKFDAHEPTIYELDAKDLNARHPVACYQGHKNSRTIKRVNTFGTNSEYVISGSDDGKMYIWDRSNPSKPVHSTVADDHVVNCLVGHPKGYPIIAASGIDNHFKILDCSSSPPTYAEKVHIKDHNADIQSRLAAMPADNRAFAMRILQNLGADLNNLGGDSEEDEDYW